MTFSIDPRLTQESHLICDLELSTLYLKDDARWCWLILIPKQSNLTELFELSTSQQAALMGEINMLSTLLKTKLSFDKINVASLGNVVPQLHIHVIGRKVDDANWPNPIWNHGSPRVYQDAEKNTVIKTILDHITNQKGISS